MSHNLRRTVEGILVLALSTVAGMLSVELEACLDEPDGVGGGACDEAGDGSSAEVYPGSLDAIVEGVGYYAFPVAVGGEVYRSGRTIVSFFFRVCRNDWYTLLGRPH